MMLGVEHQVAETTEAPSTSGQASEERSPLAKSAAKLLYKRFKVRAMRHYLTHKRNNNGSQCSSISINFLQIQVRDGRVLIGDFTCIDKQGNIILNQTVEQYESNGKLEEKVLGQVLIPATQRVSCECEVVTAEKESIESLLESTLNT